MPISIRCKSKSSLSTFLLPPEEIEPIKNALREERFDISLIAYKPK
jgi:hypothetical protein